MKVIRVGEDTLNDEKEQDFPEANDLGSSGV